MITLTQDELTAVINAHVAAATAKIYADLAKPAVDKINAQIAPPVAVVPAADPATPVTNAGGSGGASSLYGGGGGGGAGGGG